jgi:hypothetical protein
MNINRHNYETFFLLYVDKELSAAERKAVEVFVQDNPDLQMELVLLQQTVVKADDIILNKKDWLYKEEDISALQENLMLYADDELNGADKKTIEAVLATDKAAQTEWAVLQQTKLQPDMDVVFTNKQSLYRKEPGRVVAFRWWRVAAAAVLLGFGIWTGVSVYKNNSTTKTGTGELAGSKNTIPGQIQTGDTAGNTAITNQPDEKSVAENIASTTDNKNNDNRVTENVKSAVEKINNQNAESPKENATVQNNGNRKPGNNLPLPERERAGKPALQNINSSNSNEITVQRVLPSNSNSNRVSGNNDAVVKLTPVQNRTGTESINSSKINPDMNALQAVNINKNVGDENNYGYLNVEDDKQKRTALGGFIRKAKRVLERNTNVKTGDGIKIAGFEIALK